MKKILTFLMFVMVLSNANAFVLTNYGAQLNGNADFAALNADIKGMELESFLELTPKKYKKMTGKKLGIKKAIQLKAAQKFVKHEMRQKGSDISGGLYILLAILGLGWLAMGLIGDWSGNDWIINLILTILCWLPGLIHALIKKDDYV